MNDFVQMDIFFFISSVAAVLLLIFITVIGFYIYTIVKKTKEIITEIQEFTHELAFQGKDAIESIRVKMEEIINNGGVAERVIATTLGTIIAKTFSKRAKIKKDAPKKK